MHGGLYVERPVFFVSHIVAGLNVTAQTNASELCRCNSSTCCHQADLERWVDGRNSVGIVIPDPFGTDLGGQKDVRKPG